VLKIALTTIAALAFAAMPTAPAEGKDFKVLIRAGDRTLTATLLDNATARALVARFPLTVPMQDLYGRELVYRFPDPLPANETTTSGYEVGDIVYWAPRHSFVLMYAQNGERISNLQKVGRINTGVEALKGIGDVVVTFELMKP